MTFSDGLTLNRQQMKICGFGPITEQVEQIVFLCFHVLNFIHVLSWDHWMHYDWNYNTSNMVIFGPRYDFNLQIDLRVPPFVTVSFKGRVHCFSMQAVMNKCFLLNPKKVGADPVLSFSRKTHTLIPKNDVTEPKARLLEYPVKLLTG